MSSKTGRFGAVVGALCLLAGVTNAEAGWRDRPGSIKDTPYVDRFSWSGLYVGMHAGWAWADVSRSYGTTDHFAPAGSGISHEDESWLAGLHVGVQKQFGQMVLGIEAAYSGGDLEDHGFSTSPSPVGSDPVQHVIKIGPIHSVAARFGFAWGKTLAYVKGGYAGADIRSTSYDSADHSASRVRWNNGWLLGGGLEWALTPNAIFGIEYSYVDFASKKYLSGVQGGGVAAPNFQAADIDADVHSVVARISFKTN